MRVPLLAFALVALALSGCKESEQSPIDTAPATPPVSMPAPLRVTALDLGNAIDAGKRISSPAAAEFHIAKPGGWPAGNYKVGVTANGTVAASKELEVK